MRVLYVVVSGFTLDMSSKTSKAWFMALDKFDRGFEGERQEAPERSCEGAEGENNPRLAKTAMRRL